MRRGNTMNRKHLVTKSCTAALSLLMLASTSVVCIPNNINQPVFAATSKRSQEPAGQYQINESFPIDEKDDNPRFDTWSLLDNINRKFYGFKGQGSVWVYSNNPKKFSLYINGRNIKLTKVGRNKWVKLDISKYTKNGNNALPPETLMPQSV